MELGQNRVWDYVGDNFVHRLMQTENFADGKLVEADGRAGDTCRTCTCNAVVEGAGVEGGDVKGDGVRVNVDEKIDSIQLEYTYLLTSQLESQRRYFEEKISRVESDAHREIEEVMSRARTSVEENTKMKAKISSLDKDKGKMEKRLQDLHSKMTKTVRQLEEEKQMNKSLRQNQAE